MYDRMLRDCQAAGVTLSIAQEAGSWQAAVSLVAAGMGVTIAPACVSRLRFPRVKFRELARPAPTYGLALCTGEGSTVAGRGVVLGELRERCRSSHRRLNPRRTIATESRKYSSMTIAHKRTRRRLTLTRLPSQSGHRI